jgi:hypothetical protein
MFFLGFSHPSGKIVLGTPPDGRKPMEEEAERKSQGKPRAIGGKSTARVGAKIAIFSSHFF